MIETNRLRSLILYVVEYYTAGHQTCFSNSASYIRIVKFLMNRNTTADEYSIAGRFDSKVFVIL